MVSKLHEALIIMGGLMGKADAGFMGMALSLAKKADPYPNPKVGAVLVKDGQVIGRGYHKGPGKPHAEIDAMRDAVRRSSDDDIARGATLYVTLEPCSHTIKRTPPCTCAIMDAGIEEVAFGMEDPNPLVDGAGELSAAGIRVRGPICPDAVASMNRRYLRLASRKPDVTIKMALSADGKSATRTGDSRWISGPASRALVHRMRASSDALGVGAGTIELDDPVLTSHGEGKDPYRVIVDGALRIDPDARVLKRRDGRTIIATCTKAPASKLALLSGATILFCGDEEVDMRALLSGLSMMGLRRILIEGGSDLNASALASGLVGRLVLFIAPKLIGGVDAKPAIGGIGIERMAQARRIKLKKTRRAGEDLMLEYEVL